MIYRIYYIHNGKKQNAFTVQDTEERVKELVELLNKNRSGIDNWEEFYYVYEPIKLMNVDELKLQLGIS